MELCECWIKHYNNDLWQKKLTHGHVIVVNCYQFPVKGQVGSQTLMRVPKMWIKFPGSTTNQKHHLNLGSDTSPVRNFFAYSSDIILQGNQWWRCKSATLIFFSLDKVTNAKIDSTFQCRQWLIYQWLHPKIDPTLPGYQWQSMHDVHIWEWEMHRERVM